MKDHHAYRLLVVVFLLLALVSGASCSRPKPSPTPMLPTAVLTLYATNTPPPAALPTSPIPQQTTVPTSAPLLTPPASVTSTPAPSVSAAALVNYQAIPLQEYEAQVSLAIHALSQQQSFDPQTEEGKAALLQLKRQILDAMIDQVLIEQAAAREGIVVPMERVDLEVARLMGEDAARFEEWLQANGMTRDSFKVQLQRQLLSAACQEHIIDGLPSQVEQVHARHILVESESEAMDLLVRLHSGESFASLAQQYSQDSATRSEGGDLGFFPRGVMPLEIEAVAFALSPGQRSGIVKTSFGYHIIEVVERDPLREIAPEMLPVWRQNKFIEWLQGQRAAAKIEYLVSLQ